MISFAALFLPVILLQISTGGVGPLDALSRFALNFSNTEIGMLGSAHFLGFLLAAGMHQIMGAVGHSQAFAAFLMESFGPSKMFILIAFAHLLLVIFGVARMRVRPTVSE